MSLTTDTDTREQHAALSVERKADRYAARRYLKKVTKSDRCKSCGHPFQHGVAVKAPEAIGITSAGFSGMSTCGSVWLCPVCSNKIATQRAADLGQGIASWTEDGQHVEFVTLTAKHSLKNSLDDCWTAVRSGWDSLASGRGWKEDRERLGIQGYHRTTEVTYGEKHGWHVHYHVLLFLDDVLTDDEREDLRGRLFARWQTGLTKVGFKALYSTTRNGVVEYPAVDIRPMRREAVEELALKLDAAYELADEVGDTTLADYLNKTGVNSAAQVADGKRLAMEVLAGNSKQGRKYAGYKNLTPFGILGVIGHFLDLRQQQGKLSAVDTATLRRFLALWASWEVFSSGMRQVTMSRNLKDMLGLRTANETDEELAAKEVALGDILGVIPPKVFTSLVNRDTSVLAEVQHVATVEGRSGLQALSDRLGLGIDCTDTGAAKWQAAQDKMFSERKEAKELLAQAERDQFRSAMLNKPLPSSGKSLRELSEADGTTPQ